MQGKRGHARTDDDLLGGVGAQHMGHGFVGLVADVLGGSGLTEMATEIAARRQHGSGNRIGDLAGHLCASRVVQEDSGA